MKKLDLRAGDVFCCSNTFLFNTIINKYQTLVAHDNKSMYGHSGIIIDKYGNTFEALHTNSFHNLYERYEDKNVIVARYTKLDEDQWQDILDPFIEKYKDRKYPYYRLALYLIPSLAKYISFNKKRLVCSELVAEFLYQAHLSCGHESDGIKWPRHEFCRGTYPDLLCDEWHRWQNFEIVFEGVLK